MTSVPAYAVDQGEFIESNNAVDISTLTPPLLPKDPSGDMTQSPMDSNPPPGHSLADVDMDSEADTLDPPVMELDSDSDIPNLQVDTLKKEAMTRRSRSQVPKESIDSQNRVARTRGRQKASQTTNNTKQTKNTNRTPSTKESTPALFLSDSGEDTFIPKSPKRMETSDDEEDVKIPETLDTTNNEDDEYENDETNFAGRGKGNQKSGIGAETRRSQRSKGLESSQASQVPESTKKTGGTRPRKVKTIVRNDDEDDGAFDGF